MPQELSRKARDGSHVTRRHLTTTTVALSVSSPARLASITRPRARPSLHDRRLLPGGRLATVRPLPNGFAAQLRPGHHRRPDEADSLRRQPAGRRPAAACWAADLGGWFAYIAASTN